MRASKNRCFHLAMVRELSLKLEYKSPAANRKMMRARRAKSARPRPVRARDSRALRSSPVSTMSAVVCGMRHTNIYMSLVQATSDGYVGPDAPRKACDRGHDGPHCGRDVPGSRCLL